MRGGGKGFIIIGVLLALGAVALVIIALIGTSSDEVDEPPVAMGSYVVAAADVPAHAILAATDVQEVEVPLDQLPADAVTSAGAVTGLAYETALMIDQVLLADQLEEPGLSNDVAQGMRAISIPVDEESTLHGLIANDDHIDIVFKARIDLLPLLPGTVVEATYQEQGGVPEQQVQGPEEDLPVRPAPGDAGSRIVIHDNLDPDGQLEPISKLVLQDLRIIRVVRPGQSFTGDGQSVNAPIVEDAPVSDAPQQSALVLEVTPQQAEALTFMRDANHSYQIVVRGRDDHAQVSTSGITFEILIENDEYALPVPGVVTVTERPTAPPAASTGSQGATRAGDEASPVAQASPAAEAQGGG